MKQFNNIQKNHSERGSAGVKLLVFGIIVLLLAHAGFNYIPVAYEAASLKQDIETDVIQGFSLPNSAGKPSDIIRKKIASTIYNYNLPDDTYVEVQDKNRTITARVYYEKKVALLPFGIYEYVYVFDHTASPNGFLTQQ